jgi:class 3 adenylate cyclase
MQVNAVPREIAPVVRTRRPRARIEPETSHTFLFADLVGFTALTAALGDAAAAELALGFWARVSGLAADHDAEPIKLIGDAAMLWGRCASQSVCLGLRLLDELREGGQFPPVRVGMHTGSAVSRGRDWFGAAVNVAARVARSAGANEVLLTEHTRRHAGYLAGVELSDRGQWTFKNVASSVGVFAAVPAPRPQRAAYDRAIRGGSDALALVSAPEAI